MQSNAGLISSIELFMHLDRVKGFAEEHNDPSRGSEPGCYIQSPVH